MKTAGTFCFILISTYIILYACGCSPAQRLFQNRGDILFYFDFHLHHYISQQALACPSELLDCKVRLRGIHVCGDSSTLQALACRGVCCLIDDNHMHYKQKADSLLRVRF